MLAILDHLAHNEYRSTLPKASSSAGIYDDAARLIEQWKKSMVSAQ
ncbi:MAG: hypothetical protein M0Q91_10575 [Methanoregula sp.]|nr:hypothetical protein [Methanoregula sp.]